MNWLTDLLWPYRLYLAAVGIAFIASVLLTPLVRRLAIRIDLVDRPDNQRKLHVRTTALGGGAALLVAFLVSSIVVFFLSASQRRVLATDVPFFLGILVAAAIIVTVGLWDDRWGLRGRQKLAGQTLAALILLAAGLWIDQIHVFGVDINLGLLAIPFTLFWLLGAVNCLNLIDGMDGLASAVGLILSLAVAIMAAMAGQRTEAFMALALAGGLAGFLFYNSPPASIFLGDAGSMLIGLILGALAIRASLKAPATVALAAPTALLAIPIMDVSMAIMRRKLTGRSIYQTDRSHLHHTLVRRGYSGSMTVCMIGTLCLVTAAGAVISVGMRSEWLAYAAVAAVFGVLLMTGIFGRYEVALLLRKLKHTIISLVPSPHGTKHRGHRLEARLQGSREWDDLWETLIEFADRFDLSSVTLNLHLPALGEDYHAAWSRRERPAESELWHSDIPLVADEITIGRLCLTGACSNGSVCEWMAELIAGLRPFETQLLELIGDGAQPDGRADDAEQPQHDEFELPDDPPVPSSAHDPK